MKAVVLKGFGGVENLKIEEVERPAAGPTEALVRVRACGVCHHDVINRQGKFGRTPLPMILGHEIAGDVVEVGPLVTRFQPGDRVAVIPKTPCGLCDQCLQGHDALCRTTGLLGETTPGGYAEYVAVPEKALVKLPDGIPYPEASILACAVGTGIHAVKARAKVQMGETALVTGATGGVGIHIVQLLKLAGARVIAVTSSQGKTGVLRELGVDEIVLAPDLNFSEQVKALTNGNGADVAFEIVGSATFPATLRSVNRGGRLVFVGNVRAEPVQFLPAFIILREVSILGTMAVTLGELHQAIDLVQQGKLRPIIAQTLPLEETAKAHTILSERGVMGRLVLTV
ncbi:MAG: alcohol dehydrogenase catalytic domain-containing protein [Chloroflexi bacterium]|nr:alcohol dehydrogenase catalytic domain-containing protein [Chloroflexota bacterium]